MNRSQLIIAVAALLLLPLLIPLAATAQDTAQVVVLRNGNVVHGTVEPAGDGALRVSNGPWYSVRVPRDDVDFVAPNLAAACRTKLQRLRNNDFRGHVQLANWCLRHDLTEPAAERLLHLSRLDPQHAAVRGLEEQLRQRANRSSPTPATVSLHVPPAPVPVPGDPVESATLTPEAVSQFTRTVQPLLLNRCGQANCHGHAGQSAFHLTRLTAHGARRKELTLRNLRAVLAFADTSDPAGSSLAQHAVVVHGKAVYAPIGPHEQRHHQRLIEWLELATQNSATDDAEAPLAGARPLAAEPALAADVVPDAPAELGTADAASPIPPPARITSPAEPGAAPATTIDPFDPAVFNARFDDQSEAAAPALPASSSDAAAAE